MILLSGVHMRAVAESSSPGTVWGLTYVSIHTWKKFLVLWRAVNVFLTNSVVYSSIYGHTQERSHSSVPVTAVVLPSLLPASLNVTHASTLVSGAGSVISRAVVRLSCVPNISERIASLIPERSPSTATYPVVWQDSSASPVSMFI